MKPLLRRRLLSMTLLASAVALLLWACRLYQTGLRGSRYLTGWLLLAILVGLAAYNLRKKLPGLPLGTAAVWLQLHAYAGLFSVALFGAHIHWRWPSGLFESSLFALYLIVALTGVGGLALSRWIPRRLGRRGEELIFERIPLFRKTLAGRLETQLASLPEAQQPKFQQLLSGAQPAAFWSQLLGSTHQLQRLQAALTTLSAELSEDERSTASQIGRTLTQQEDLAFHQANQWLLKAWLFVHIPATWALLIAAMLHGLLAHAFGGFA